MATTLTSTSNFGDFPSEYVSKTLLEKGTIDDVYYDLADKVGYPEGAGQTARFGRYQPVKVNIQALTEGGADPTPQALAIDKVEATLADYGDGIELSEMHELTIMHDSFQEALEEAGIALRHGRSARLIETLLAGANVIYPGSATTRATIGASDVATELEIKKAVSKLRRPQLKQRAAVPWQGDMFMGVWDTDMEFDLLGDSTFEVAAQRNLNMVDQELRKAAFGAWGGAVHKRTNWSPRFENSGDPTIVDGTPVSAAPYAGGPVTLVGLTLTGSNAGGSLTASTAYDFQITAVHKYRGFEEIISGTIDHSTGAGETRMIVVMPDDADYWYHLYVGANGGTMYRAASYQEADATFNVDSVPTSGSTAPVAPAEGRKVRVAHIFGKQAFKSLEFKKVEGLVAGGKGNLDTTNYLGRKRILGYNYKDAHLLCNANWIYRIEAESAFD